MFSSRSVQIAALFSDVFGQALPNLCRSFYNETKAEMFFSVFAVALLAEGVDRNTLSLERKAIMEKSPSSRRAWIEMEYVTIDGVDYKASPSSRRAWIEISLTERASRIHSRSPSSRRAWIEMTKHQPDWKSSVRSPSSRRAWIEMQRGRAGLGPGNCRPPRGGRG